MNFTNISNAIKAIDGIKNKPEYANLRIAHGKDRCANPPRSGPQGGSGGRRTVSNNGPNSAEPVSAVGEDDAEAEAFLNGADEAHILEQQDMHVDGETHLNGVAA